MKFDFLLLIDSTEDVRRKFSEDLSVPEIFRAYATFLLKSEQGSMDMSALEKFETHGDLASHRGEWLFQKARAFERRKDWEKATETFRFAARELRNMGSQRRFVEAICGEFISKYRADRKRMSLAEWSFTYQRAKKFSLWERVGELLVAGFEYHQSQGMPGAAAEYEKKMRKLEKRSSVPLVEEVLRGIESRSFKGVGRGATGELSALEAVLIEYLQHGPKSKGELVALLYPKEDYFVAENRLKNLLNRVRKKMKNSILFSEGKYVLAAGATHDMPARKKVA